MAGADDSFTRSDLELLHGALSYMRKRVFDQGESIRITGMIERIEDLLLAPAGETRSLRLSPPEQEALRRQVFAYCEELTRRGGSEDGREQARKLQGLADRMTKKPAAATRWFRRLFGG